MDFVINMQKNPRRYSIEFAAATLAAAITSPAFLNCKKLGRNVRALPRFHEPPDGYVFDRVAMSAGDLAACISKSTL